MNINIVYALISGIFAWNSACDVRSDITKIVNNNSENNQGIIFKTSGVGFARNMINLTKNTGATVVSGVVCANNVSKVINQKSIIPKKVHEIFDAISGNVPEPSESKSEPLKDKQPAS